MEFLQLTKTILWYTKVLSLDVAIFIVFGLSSSSESDEPLALHCQ